MASSPEGQQLPDADPLVALLTDVLPGAAELAGAETAYVVRRAEDDGATVVLARTGVARPWDDDVLTRADVPSCPLTDAVGLLVLVPPAGLGIDDHRSALATSLLDTSLGRLRAVRELADLSARVDNAQQLANMGDYDWHIPTDTNRWSDHLYRIYGFEPQAFNATYDRFLALIHPEDRDRIVAIHQQAYATGEPYQMIERIVRPDGEVRYLSSNGQVHTDESGTPVRMRGTCVDITERVLAEQAQQEIAASLREADLRRRQALQINDNVVQGLTTALYALEMGELSASTSYLQRTLSAARKMIDDLVAPLATGEVGPGDLVRTSATSLGGGPAGGGA